jgi:hypothetical protein
MLNDNEIETLRKGAMGAGLLVSVSDPGFFDTLKEAGTLAKNVAAARGSSESAVVRRVAEGHGTGFGVTTHADEIEAGTLGALRSAVQLLQSKAPGELDAYRSFVLDLARSVAEAAPGGDAAEAGAVAKIEAALGDSPAEAGHDRVKARRVRRQPGSLSCDGTSLAAGGEYLNELQPTSDR